jgi:hypothetical protein
MNPKKSSIVPDELVETLVTDPSVKPDVAIVKGWIGQSTRTGYWRLYPAPDLKSFVEIAEDDILMSKPIATNISPLGGTVVVIKSTAKLHGEGGLSVDARTAYLRGDVTRDLSSVASNPTAFLMSIGKGPGGGLGDVSYTEGFWCNVSLLFSCTTHVVDDDVCTLASGKLCGTANLLP